MFYEVKKEEITTAVIQRLHKGFHPIYNSAGIDGFSHAILEKLDSGNYFCKPTFIRIENFWRDPRTS